MALRRNKGTHTVDPDQLDTYFKKRMFEMGIQETADHFFMVDVEYPGRPYKQPVFTENKNNGNIEIHYPSLYGGPEMVKSSETEFVRQRLHPDSQPSHDVKYYQDKGSGVHIFFPPALIEKFNAKTKIDTLFLVEGEFKAFAGTLHGLDVCGLGGKDLFADEDKELHADIVKVVDTCKVKNLVLLLDADVFHLQWDPEEDPNKDLAKRQVSFFNSVKRFRELAKNRVKDCYFSHIKSDFINEAKGLDDLLFVRKKSAAKVLDDLRKLTSSRAYFICKNLSADSINKIKSYFLLTYFKGVPNTFYAWHEDLIKDKEFTFQGARYQNVKNEGLQLVKHQDSFKFIRVGCDYFKLIRVPNSKKILEQRRIAWKVGEIQRDYVAKGLTNFFDTIDKYDAFCNVPDNTETYDATPENCFNLYYRLEHVPEEGKWPHIETYLKHLFGTKPIGDGSTTNYELALDCIQLKYLHPTQKLPIVCLVSKDRGTGKSSFLWLMREIFNENATVIGNQEINDMYNDDWASKAIIGIDEGFIDKKIILEKIKSQSTNDKIKLRGMYQGRQDVSFFGWFILTSNDEDNFITIDNEEIRFWVNKVPQLKEEDPDLLAKMIEEIPAFLHFLKNRALAHPKKTRFWFAKDLLETDALKRIKETSRGWFSAELKEELTDRYFHYKHHTLYYTLDELFSMLNKPNAPVRFRKADIRKQLEDKFKLKAKLGRYKHPTDPDSPEMGQTMSNVKEKLGRCYEFRIENFLTEEEIRTELGEYIDFDEVVKSRSPHFIAMDPAPVANTEDDLPF